MKTIYKKTGQYIVLLSLIFASCNNNLDEVVYSELTEESYTYTNAYQAIGVAYANMRGLISHQNFYMVQETSADAIVMPANASGWDDGGIYRRMHEHTWNSESMQMNNMWNTLYAGVINTNRVIDQLRNGTVPPPADLSSESLVAEVRTIRAFFYWLLIDNFGDVPLITTRSDELPEKTERSTIFQFIVTELTESIPSLSEEKNVLYYARFNKWAAKTLLANVYLNAEVYTGQPMWQEALNECDDVIKSGKYQLESDLKAAFRTENTGSSEIIFALPFDENQAGGFSVHMFSLHGSLRNKFDMLTTPWGAGSAKGISQFIDTYDESDQRLPAFWMIGPQYASDGRTPLVGSYDQGGKPLIFTKDLPDGIYTGEAEGYRMNKFEVKTGALGSLSNDFPFFRYAQVLLIKAECLLRLGQSNDAASLVTEVRARAFTETPSKATVTGDELLQNSRYQYGFVEDYEITAAGDNTPIQFGRMLDELGWEFVWEAHRRRDMIRFGVYTTKSWLSHKPNGNYRTVFPIPQIAINSNPKLVQHTDYQ